MDKLQGLYQAALDLSTGFEHISAQLGTISLYDAQLDKNRELNPIVKNNFIFFILSPFYNFIVSNSDGLVISINSRSSECSISL